MMQFVRAVLALVFLAGPGLCCCSLHANEASPASQTTAIPPGCCCHEEAPDPAEQPAPVREQPAAPKCPCKKHQDERQAIRSSGDDLRSEPTEANSGLDCWTGAALSPATVEIGQSKLDSGLMDAFVLTSRARLHWLHRLTC